MINIFYWSKSDSHLNTDYQLVCMTSCRFKQCWSLKAWSKSHLWPSCSVPWFVFCALMGFSSILACPWLSNIISISINLFVFGARWGQKIIRVSPIYTYTNHHHHPHFVKNIWRLRFTHFNCKSLLQEGSCIKLYHWKYQTMKSCYLLGQINK